MEHRLSTASSNQPNRDGLEAGVRATQQRADEAAPLHAIVVAEPATQKKEGEVLFLEALRSFNGRPVDGPQVLDMNHPVRRANATFVQFLVNRRTEQAYAREEGDDARANEIAAWFTRLEEQLSELAEEKLTLTFARSPKFAFALRHANGRESPFHALPAGYGSIIELFSQVVMRSEAKKA